MSLMASLSWELLDLILSYLQAHNDDSTLRSGTPPPPSLLPLYATVCRDWTDHFEQRTFKTLRIKNTDLGQASRIVKGRRATAVCRIEYEILLPTYSDHACAKFENKKDQDRNEFVFSDSMHGLFKMLKTWETEIAPSGNIGPTRQVEDGPLRARPRAYELVLADVYSPMDAWHRGEEKISDDSMQWELGERHDLFEKRWQHSYLQLNGVEALPQLLRPVRFTSQNSTRDIAPATLIGIASKCNNISSIMLECSDSELKYPEIRQQLRYDFSQSIERLPLHSLVSFNLEYRHASPQNQNFVSTTALHESSPATDHLSIALHHLSQAPNLANFTLTEGIVISPALFWPPDSGTATPYWPNLKKISVTFSPCTPSCSWYFVRDPSKTADDDSFDTEHEERRARHAESDTDSDSNASSDSEIWDSYHPVREGRAQGMIPNRRFRDWPNDKEILPLIAAAAKAVKCMPKLEMMALAVSPGSRETFELDFLAEGVIDFQDEIPERDVERARLYCQTGDWRPSEDVLGLWKEAVPHGQEGLLIKFFQ